MTQEPPEAKWLRFREETNALDYLERAVLFLQETATDISNWKWVAIGLHGALYGFLVAATAGTDYTRILKKNGKLFGFWEVLKLAQDPTYMKMLVHSQNLVLSPQQEDSIDMLSNLLRNKFMHFAPTSLSLEIHGMPQITIDVLEVVQFVALDTHTYIHLNEDEIERVRNAVLTGVQFARSSTLYDEMLLAKRLYEDGGAT
jgi:hypothetical protein